MNKLSELSKPVAWADERGNLCTDSNKSRMLDSRWAEDYGKYSKPVYSQEYVSALLADNEKKEKLLISNAVEYEMSTIDLLVELEAKDKRIAELEQEPTIKHMRSVEEALISATDRASELEARLATPVPVPSFDCYKPDVARELQEGFKNTVRAAGFTVEGDE